MGCSLPGMVSPLKLCKEDEPPVEPGSSSPGTSLVPLPEPLLPESLEVTEESTGNTSPSEAETKVDIKEEDLEEEDDQIVSSAEAESVVETVASEEMVVETVIEDSLSSGVNLEMDEDKESVKSEPLDSDRGVPLDQGLQSETDSGREPSSATSGDLPTETPSKDQPEREDQIVMDSRELKESAKFERNDDVPSPLSPGSPKKKAAFKRSALRKKGRLLVAEEEEDRESKDASIPETPSSASPVAETSSNLDEPQSEDLDDDKLKDDKSSIEDVKTPETPSGDMDAKDDTSQHAESGGEEVAGDLRDLSKHLLSSVGDSVPNSPASMLQSDDPESVRDYKVWKKAIMLVWRAAANHKYANVFLHPVTDEMAPGYHSIVYRPMDLLTIKKNIESGYIKTTLEFQRDMMLMFQNAIMYNSSDHDVFHMAIEMQKEVMGHIQDFLATQLMVKSTETKSLRGRERDGREKKLDSTRDEKEEEKKKKVVLQAEEPQAKKRRTRTNE